MPIKENAEELKKMFQYSFYLTLAAHDPYNITPSAVLCRKLN